MKYNKSMNQKVLEGVIVQQVNCAFIDDKQAFDMVLQDGMWTKILYLKRDRWKMFKIYY